MIAAVPLETFVLGPEHNGIRMTPEEFDAIAECDPEWIYELVEGVVVVNPPASRNERDPNEELGHWLRTYRDSHPEGRCLDATLSEDQVRTDRSRRRADRAIWIGLGRLPDAWKDVPTIAVEFVSPGRRNWLRDYVQKRDEYLALGVREYWVIDRFRRQMTVFRRDATGEAAETVEGEQDTYRTDLLPGFELPLGPLLAAANRWDADDEDAVEV